MALPAAAYWARTADIPVPRGYPVESYPADVNGLYPGQYDVAGLSPGQPCLVHSELGPYENAVRGPGWLAMFNREARPRGPGSQVPLLAGGRPWCNNIGNLRTQAYVRGCGGGPHDRSPSNVNMRRFSCVGNGVPGPNAHAHAAGTYPRGTFPEGTFPNGYSAGPFPGGTFPRGTFPNGYAGGRGFVGA